MGKTVREYKAGKVEFRNDSGGNVHAVVGKISFDGEKLAENIQSFIDYVQSLKPAAVRGQYVRGISISAHDEPGNPPGGVDVKRGRAVRTVGRRTGRQSFSGGPGFRQPSSTHKTHPR